jgi:phosphoribosylglycinamide formyltransferase-1
MTKRIAIFASGSGTNAENIIKYFSGSSRISCSLVLCNKPGAKVLDRADRLGVPTMVFNREDFYKSNLVVDRLLQEKIDLVVLAGFLWLVPKNLLHAFSGRMINIHPALLPKYGGKGMYGMKVHEEVRASGDNETGITIHYVNEKYDEGKTIFQAKCKVETEDTPESIAQKVHTLEYRYYPEVIEKLLSQQ